MRIGKMLDLLAAIRKCNDKFVIVTIRLAPDLVEQSRVSSLEKPNHRCVYRPVAVRHVGQLAP
jgi:hypothetical protein